MLARIEILQTTKESFHLLFTSDRLRRLPVAIQQLVAFVESEADQSTLLTQLAAIEQPDLPSFQKYLILASNTATLAKKGAQFGTLFAMDWAAGYDPQPSVYIQKLNQLSDQKTLVDLFVEMHATTLSTFEKWKAKAIYFALYFAGNLIPTTVERTLFRLLGTFLDELSNPDQFNAWMTSLLSHLNIIFEVADSALVKYEAEKKEGRLSLDVEASIVQALHTLLSKKEFDVEHRCSQLGNKIASYALDRITLFSQWRRPSLPWYIRLPCEALAFLLERPIAYITRRVVSKHVLPATLNSLFESTTSFLSGTNRHFRLTMNQFVSNKLNQFEVDLSKPDFRSEAIQLPGGEKLPIVVARMVHFVQHLAEIEDPSRLAAPKTSLIQFFHNYFNQDAIIGFLGLYDTGLRIGANSAIEALLKLSLNNLKEHPEDLLSQLISGGLSSFNPQFLTDAELQESIGARKAHASRVIAASISGVLKALSNGELWAAQKAKADRAVEQMKRQYQSLSSNIQTALSTLQSAVSNWTENSDATISSEITYIRDQVRVLSDTLKKEKPIHLAPQFFQQYSALENGCNAPVVALLDQLTVLERAIASHSQAALEVQAPNQQLTGLQAIYIAVSRPLDALERHRRYQFYRKDLLGLRQDEPLRNAFASLLATKKIAYANLPIPGFSDLSPEEKRRARKLKRDLFQLACQHPDWQGEHLIAHDSYPPYAIPLFLQALSLYQAAEEEHFYPFIGDLIASSHPVARAYLGELSEEHLDTKQKDLLKTLRQGPPLSRQNLILHLTYPPPPDPFLTDPSRIRREDCRPQIEKLQLIEKQRAVLRLAASHPILFQTNWSWKQLQPSFIRTKKTFTDLLDSLPVALRARLLLPSQHPLIEQELQRETETAKQEIANILVPVMTPLQIDVAKKKELLLRERRRIGELLSVVDQHRNRLNGIISQTQLPLEVRPTYDPRAASTGALVAAPFGLAVPITSATDFPGQARALATMAGTVLGNSFAGSLGAMAGAAAAHLATGGTARSAFASAFGALAGSSTAAIAGSLAPHISWTHPQTLGAAAAAIGATSGIAHVAELTGSFFGNIPFASPLVRVAAGFAAAEAVEHASRRGATEIDAIKQRVLEEGQALYVNPQIEKTFNRFYEVIFMEWFYQSIGRMLLDKAARLVGFPK
jgi:hypothetical protein